MAPDAVTPSSKDPTEDSKQPRVLLSRGKDASDTESGTVEERNGSAAQEVAEAIPKRSWKSYLWDTLDKTPEERAFLFKLDAVLLSLASFGYFIKYLVRIARRLFMRNLHQVEDQVNVSNAFVSGMQDDLELYGNELNYMTMTWTVGYVLGEIPSNMLLTRLRPSIWLPACEMTWSVMTILMTQCTTAKQIYVLRFFIGLAEGGFYPGMQYIIGSWYRSDELAKRSCIFHAAGAAGQMFSGYLMAGAVGLDGRDGYPGWKWLFIINTVISLPVATVGFFMFPDLPEITRAWWLTDEQKELSRRRMELEGRAKRQPYTRAKFIKIFSSWHIYALTLLYILFNNGNNFGSQPAFAQWLKDLGYPVKAYNTFPTINQAITIIFTLIYAWSSDSIFRGRRWPPIVFSGVVKIVIYSGLTAWDIPLGFKWFCFLFEGLGSGISGLTFAWAHEICSDDNEERALVTATMNEMAYVMQAWLPLVIWQQVESPRFPKGMPTMIAFSIALITTAFAIRYLHKREKARKATQDDDDDAVTEVNTGGATEV